MEGSPTDSDRSFPDELSRTRMIPGLKLRSHVQWVYQFVVGRGSAACCRQI